MPHRILPITDSVSIAIEGLLVAGIAIFNGIPLMTGIQDDDWEKMIGPHGAMFIMAVGLIVLWGTMTYNARERRKDDKLRELKEEERRKGELKQRDQHHKEVMEMQRENSAKIFKLQEKASDREVRAYEAMESVGRGMHELTEELKKRPCQCLTFRYKEEDYAIEEETDITKNP